MKNWEASIRQNRRKAKHTEPLVENREPERAQTPKIQDSREPWVEAPVPQPPVPVKSESIFDSTELNAEIEILPNSLFASADPSLAYGNMVDGIVDDIRSCAETLDQTKIPMANSYYHEPKVEYESTANHAGYTAGIHFA